MSPKEKVNVFWFRRDLRIKDNCGLFYALQEKLPVIPIFIFDTIILDELNNPHDKRVDFIHRTLQMIDDEFKKSGSRLFTFHGRPVDVLNQLVKQYDIDSVFTNHDYEPYAIQRDMEIGQLLETKRITFSTFKDQVVFEKDEIVKPDGKPYTVYTPYRRAWSKKLNAKEIAPHPSEKRLDRLIQTAPKSVISLEKMGFKKTNIEFELPNFDESIVEVYDKQRDFPDREGTTRLGVHLRFGTVSVRELVRRALDLNETWLSELIWREFFMMILYHFPYVVDKPFREKYQKMSWSNDQEAFEKWCKGMTGYPLVDAGMRELNETGFMHNRVRMVTASFLTKHLLIDWRKGERYFAEKLMDYDLSANNGNWQWAAGCGCDAAPYFRIFNPYTQAEKFDPQQKYVKQWLPEINSDIYPEPIVDHKQARERALAALSSL